LPFQLLYGWPITAGAYTACVIDYLIEALEEWEKEKKSDNVEVTRQFRYLLLCPPGADAY